MRALLLLVLLALSPGPAVAEIYRCVQADGSVRFSGSATCADGRAEPHAPSREIQRTAPAAPAVPPADAAQDTSPIDPERALLEEVHVAPGWDVVGEAPEALDPDLQRWGVRDKSARHYTRDIDGLIQVCSVEVWAFEDASRASAAHDGFAYPDWRILQAGRALVMLRGLSRARGSPPRRGVFPDCHALGERIRARAAGLSP